MSFGSLTELLNKRAEWQPRAMTPSWCARAISILGIAVLLLVGQASTASAEVPSNITGATKDCVQVALARKVSNWTCLGSALVTKSGTEKIPTSSPNDTVSTAALPNPDDYDTWCENGSTCHRKIYSLPGSPAYSSETKGNAAYGDVTGVINTYDVIIRTNLNGRQPQWRLTYIHDSGPTLTFVRSEMYCREVVGLFFDSVCGIHFAGAPFIIGPLSRRWDSGLIYGNRLTNSATYYGHNEGQIQPVGNYPPYVIPHLETLRFNCFGTDRCYFP